MNKLKGVGRGITVATEDGGSVLATAVSDEIKLDDDELQDEEEDDNEAIEE